MQPQKPAVTTPSIYQSGQLRYEVRGWRVTPLSDLDHFLMKSAWWKLLGAFGAIYVGVNARPGSFANDFWFSVQTFAIIGYGNSSPGTTYANLLVTLGHRMRRVHALALERDAMPMFILAWTVLHPLDEKRPLHGLTVENAAERVVGLIVSFSGVDDTKEQTPSSPPRHERLPSPYDRV